MQLSVCVMTRAPTGRLAAIVESLRPVADEVVIAVEDGIDAGSAASLLELADVVRLFPHREPGDSVIPWLHSLCSGDWILNVDDDEFPSAALIAALPGLTAARGLSHYWLARRWLWQDPGHFLDEAPWGNEWVLKLVRNDPATLRFSDEFHRPVVVSGASRYVEAPLWHADFVLQPWDYRRAKALAYEHDRRGMRVDGLSLNAAFYLPELRGELRVGEVPDADRRLLESALAAPPPAVPREPWGSPQHSSNQEIDRFWPDGWRPAGSLHRGRIDPLQRVERLTADVQQTIDVVVTNESDWTWGGGESAVPEVRIAARWRGRDGYAYALALRTPFPSDLGPRESQVVPVHVVPPKEPGPYRLEIQLVHEHERWFGTGLEIEVEVTPRRLVALLGSGQPLAAELDRILLEPELEPVLVELGGELPAERFGHPHVPGLRDYLFRGLEDATRARLFVTLGARTRRLVRRAARFGSGKPTAPLPYGADAFLTAVAGCEQMIVVSRDTDAPLTRELWRLAATVRAADRLGVPITVHEQALAGPQGLTDRLLVRSVLRHGTPVSIEGRGTR